MTETNIDNGNADADKFALMKEYLTSVVRPKNQSLLNDKATFYLKNKIGEEYANSLSSNKIWDTLDEALLLLLYKGEDRRNLLETITNIVIEYTETESEEN